MSVCFQKTGPSVAVECVGKHLKYSGCTEARCTAGSGDRTGYVLAASAATAVSVSSIGPISCNASGWPVYGAPAPGALPQVHCNESKGTFEFYGCEPVCTPLSGNRTGYLIAHKQSTTVVGLGAISCDSRAADYWRIDPKVPPRAVCTPQGFVFTGCEPHGHTLLADCGALGSITTTPECSFRTQMLRLRLTSFERRMPSSPRRT